VVQSVLITTKDVSSNPVHGEVYSIQHDVIKFVGDLQQVGDYSVVIQHLVSERRLVNFKGKRI
jgi:hypothetical protein